MQYFKPYVVHWISCQTKKKVSLYLNSKCQTHPEVNFGTLKVILRSFSGQVQFFLNKCSSMDKLLNKGKSKSPTLFKVPNTL